jgi:hypothetical protein
LRLNIGAQLKAFGAAKADEARQSGMARYAHAVTAAGLLDAIAQFCWNGRAAFDVNI